MSEYVIRNARWNALTPNLQGFVCANWLRSLRHQNEFFKMIDPPSYWAAYRTFINMLLNKPETVVHLALLKDDHDVVLGFSVSREHVLDYVYVAKDMRRHGICSSLVHGESTFTHITKTWKTIWAKKFPEMKFNPFA